MKITNEVLLKLGYTSKSIWTPPHSHTHYYICYGKQKKAAYEHLLVYEAEFGPIPKGHIVHHKDGNGLNNNLDNLELMTRSQHRWEHGKKIYIDGELKTLGQIMTEFNYYDKSAVTKALIRASQIKVTRGRLAGHEVKYL